jgi:hypothetical protein
MKLPRYLQITLVLGGGLSLWSFFSTPGSPPQEARLLPQTRVATPVVAARTNGIATEAEAAESTINLFPFQGGQEVPSQDTQLLAPLKATPSDVPPLPFQVNGTWWEKKQRALVLTDGEQQWIICRQCRARDKIWTGATLEHNWKLVEVGTDFLTFRWLPQQRDQRLALGDMTSKPKL